MATFEKRGPYQIRAKIRKHGHRTVTKTFNNMADAKTWARQIEAGMDRGDFIPTTIAQQTTVREVLRRYQVEVFPRLVRGGRDEKSRLERLEKTLGDLSLLALDASHVAAYRNRREKEVSPQTVKHELGLLNRVLKCCVMDWGIHLPRGIVTAQVRKPALPAGRDRRLHIGEEQRLIAAATASKSKAIENIMIIALETAARRGEIANMRWEHINLKSRTWIIPFGETRKSPRTVPLSLRAITILRGIPHRIDGNVWGVEKDSISQAFSRACKRAGSEDLRFHDLRHEATSRLFEKGLNIMEVAAITGHKDLKMLKRYTHLRAEDLAAKLG